MEAGNIIKEAMKICGWSQKTLAEKVGYVNEKGEGMQTSISNRINNNNQMRLSIFVKFLDAMGFEVIVKSKNPNSNKNEWKVSL